MLAYNYNQKGEYLGRRKCSLIRWSPANGCFTASATPAEPPAFDPVRQELLLLTAKNGW